MAMASQFASMKSPANFSDVAMFYLSSLVTGPSFMSILLLALELWQFLFFIFLFSFQFSRDRPEIRVSETSPPEFYPISRDCSKLLISNFSNEMLEIAKKFQCYNFYRFWVIKEEPTGE